MGREESQGLLDRAPESMRGGWEHEDDDSENSGPVWSQRVRRRLPFVHSRVCRGAVVGLLLFAITLGFLITSIKSIGAVKDAPFTPQEPDTSKEPVKQPIVRPSDPPEYYAPIDDVKMPFPSSYQCKDGQFESTEKYAFVADADRALSIQQKVTKDDGRRGAPVRTHGDVIFRRTKESPFIRVDIRANDERIVVKQKYNSDLQELVLTVPRIIPWNNGEETPCLSMRVTVGIPPSASLEVLKAETVNLDVKLLDNLSMAVGGYTQIQSTVGRVVAATNGQDDIDRLIRDGAPSYFRFESRLISVKTTSADIEGAWPLYDVLSLESTSGKIRAGIEPKPDDNSDPRPANLFVKSTSGDVEFWEPVHKAQQTLLRLQQQGGEGLAPTALKKPEDVIPPRVYNVNVHTISGNQKGAVAFTYNAVFKSTSGKLAVDLMPILPASAVEEDMISKLETSATSGTAVVRVLEPLWIGDLGYTTAPAPLLRAPQGTAPAPVTPKNPVADSDRGIVVPAGGGLGDRYNVPSGSPSIYIPPGSAAPSISGRALTTKQAMERFLRLLRARHTTTSATMELRYPGSWQGDIDVSSMSGKLRVGGEGVKIIKNHEDWPGFNRRIIARKGDVAQGKGSSILVKTTSGDVGLRVGDLTKR